MNQLQRLTCLSALLLSGCATSTDVHPIGGGQYFISIQSAQLLAGKPYLSERSAYNEAKEFCESQGKGSVEVIHLDIKQSVLQTPGHINLTFCCGS
jgi:hypothetical protein